MSGTLITEAIPVLTRSTINFEPYQYNAQQDALDRQGRAVTIQIPQSQQRGMGVVINSLVGSAVNGFKDFGYEEFDWGPEVTPAVANVHNGLSTWTSIIAGESGAAVVEAAKLALLGLVKSSIPSFADDVDNGLAVELAARLQRIESTLRWDYPQENQIIAFVQFGSNAEFSRTFQSIPFVFWPKSKIKARLPQDEQANESDEDYAIRLAIWMAANNVGDLQALLLTDAFKSLARQIYLLVFTELKAKVHRYANINLTTVMAGFDSSYPLIVAAAAL